MKPGNDGVVRCSLQRVERALYEEETERLCKIKFRASADDPTVVSAKCTRIKKEEKILEMAQSILGTLDIPASQVS